MSMKRSACVLLASVTLLLAACSPPTAHEAGVRNATNDYRVNVVGVGAEGLSYNLQTDARNWANYLAYTQTFQHSDLFVLLDKYPGLNTCGENIARGPRDFSAIIIVNAWRTSPPHDLNLRNPAFTMTGVGAAFAVDGIQYTVAMYCG